MTAQPNDDAKLAVQLARTAGDLLLAVRRDALTEGRALGDAGDAIAHQYLVRALAAQRPDDAVLSEEGKADAARLDKSRVWIVDPLDGTREYSESRSDWAVHVALTVDGVPAAGAVALPGLGLTLSSDSAGGAMGAVGALIMAWSRRRLDWQRLRDGLESTTRLSVFVMFILIGATVFSFTFTAADGKVWVEHLFDKLPGGQIGFLIFVNAVVFVLGFFLDFFEIAFILIPLLAPIAEKLNIDLIWFGIMIAMNLQTSFLTPPFGFALFYLRSVAPATSYIDRVTRKRIEAMRTGDIYRGSIAFVCIQLTLLALLMFFPELVTGSLDAKVDVDLDSIQIAPHDGGWGDSGGGGAWGNDAGGSDAPAGDEAPAQEGWGRSAW